MTESINHHLTEDFLMSYAAGTLPEAFSLVVATHVSLCDECRAQVEAYEALGGAVLASGDEVAPSADSLEATLSRITSGPAAPEHRPIRVPGLFPSPLQGYVGGDLGAVKWKSVGMGVRQAILANSRDASVRLLHIPAGSAVPDHGHNGRELTLVLQGAFRDSEGRFTRGDVEVADGGLSHTPVAEAGEDCICLAATEGRLRFRDLLPRLAQPFVRI
jgi:putative transcriptional regulator